MTSLGVEEEFHVVDLLSRELVAQAPKLLEHLPDDTYSDELQRSVVESNTPVCNTLDDLRQALVNTRRRLVEVATPMGLGVVAAGTVPLVDPLQLSVTPNRRYEHMLDEYQTLVREQLICGAQVHVQVSDRDLAVRIAQRVTPRLPVLLALSASSPFWMGEDSGYASNRSLLWSRWPTAGLSGEVNSAAEHDQLIADLVDSGTISDAGMIYFDVRPSSHLPTLELRLTDACPDLDTVVLLAGLFRAMVRQEAAAITAGEPARRWPSPLLRSALWRAARSGLEGDLLDLPRSSRPVPAAQAVHQLLDDLRPQLEEAGDWDRVTELAERALVRGSSAAEQRTVYERRERFADVVDMLVRRTDPDQAAPTVPGEAGHPLALPLYREPGDEALAENGPTPAYEGMFRVLEELGPAGMRQRERRRDEEQRSNGVTFGVPGRASARLFPVDLLPRVVQADEWSRLSLGLRQRAAALDLFLHDIYGERAVLKDGVVPAWVVESAPGLRGTGALVHRQKVRAHISGMDLVKDSVTGEWLILEDNLRAPSGLGYSVQNRRLSDAVMGDLPRPARMLDPDVVPSMLLETLQSAALPSAPDTPQVVLLSDGPESSPWFEHRMLANEMGVPVAVISDLLVENDTVYLLREGGRTRVDVLYLRVDEEALLHSSGADGRPIGPSLLSAVGAARVVLANAPGNGVGDDKAVYAFVPQMIEYYLNEKPLLNSVPTFLCGLPDQAAQVLDRIEQLVLKPVDGYGGEGVLIGPLASEQEIEAHRKQLKTAPHRWIAQDMVQLSTMPCFTDDQLTAHHVDLRAFVLNSGTDELRVAPTALTRVAPAGSMVVNSSRGGGSKDTWLLA
ncbi:carboxylate--amine ligase/circularly permuted type 2 ATP-grasp protein [Kineosporia sp. J2-2]|uniref:Putative glutamate--cysteine ligase 2 n=1 Tax=Kineosporia corallincola TaxID=2835133 RepID=A0ABS5TNP6_9ACTN|nr:carboxylate--amine ligase/circularly permuted type 2 ATP-grasp protein [Kineosporia corallincola]